jgi:transposase
VPAIRSWLLEPLWDQFAALLPDRSVYDPAHPLGSHRPRIGDRVIFEKLVQVLRFGCSYEAIADCTCSATTIRERRSEWIKAGIFARLKQIALESYDRIVGMVLQEIAVDGCITKAPGGRRMRRPQPGGPRQAGHEALQHDRRVRHPAGPAAGPGQSARLPAAGLHAGQTR